MYSVIRNVNILVSLLKKFDIRNIVVSPGSRNIPIAVSIEKDDFFKCYSIVDERSAAFFGIGLIQKLKQPVAICCTSGTAVCNYLSAVTEAYYQKLPLIVITADRNIYYLNQLEDQDIPQMSYFVEVTKKSVCLPIVNDEKSEWYCWRLVNEALLGLDHHGTGPVHINVPIEIGPEEMDFSLKELPELNCITRLTVESKREEWKRYAERLKKTRKILIIYGQSFRASAELSSIIGQFFKKYNCVIATELISNLWSDGIVNLHRIFQFHSGDFLDQAEPEIVITLGGNYVSDIKGKLKSNKWNFEHWLVCEEGLIADPYRKLTNVFECSPQVFFSNMTGLGGNDILEHSYYDLWKENEKQFVEPFREYNDVYVVSEFMRKIPDHALLHVANSTSIRIAELFSVKETVDVFCNRGTNGIDGSLSAFIGAASVSDELCFLLIGDLSFFYDMNGLWNRYIGKNIRILLNNNSGAGIFHYIRSEKIIPSLDNLVAAEHDAMARKWVESRGFLYLSAYNMKEFEDNITKFFDANLDSPVFFEVFTDKKTDAEALKRYYESNKTAMKGMKKIVGKVFKI
ncbi:MAG: 2-succinyl-5-enolpyruvyl-6-hydroxy-3-cyclohexene-1-carboxylic-acid synthase [Lachnospiraceae bacterium]|nr:2-succinyl-5-enolpyruvyl-6-hydroxy-3-cyclohexene-1-carboxylic-acid synthase [Lachnospiraceae bacterium]